MIIGFTGTREGMSLRQKMALVALLRDLRPSAMHHGDCIGADAQAHLLASMLAIPLYLHPAAGKGEDGMHVLCARSLAYASRAEPLPPLARNALIVVACDVLIAAPLTDTEEMRSGTWHTVRLAREAGKRVEILGRAA